jgi:hypothetical protein
MSKQRPCDVMESLSYFFVYPEVSERLIHEIDQRVDSLKDSMQYINTRRGLIDYIKNERESLQNIIMVLNVSEEYFKRIVTMIRARHGLEVSSEWSLNLTRNYFINNQWFQDDLCNLLLNGAEDKELAKLIPMYNLRAFKIDATTIARLSNRDLMWMLLKNDFNSEFSAACSQLNLKRVEDVLINCAKRQNVSFNRDISLRLAGNREQIPYAISTHSSSAPFIFIMVGFYLTTGSTQTSFVTKISRLKQYIKDSALEASVVAIIDGAGWVARHSDFEEVCSTADAVYTLNSLPEISELIEELK